MAKGVLRKLLIWAVLLAAIVFGFSALPEDPSVLSDRMKTMLLPYLKANWIAALFLVVPSLIAGALLTLQSVEWKASRERPPEPDMPIRELFDYLRLQAEWTRPYEKLEDWVENVAIAVEDKLRLAQIMCWGRSTAESTDTLHSALREIPSHVWHGHTLDLAAILTGEGARLARTYPLPMLGSNEIVRFYDLTVSRQQVHRAWPRASLVTRWWRLRNRYTLKTVWNPE